MKLLKKTTIKIFEDKYNFLVTKKEIFFFSVIYLRILVYILIDLRDFTFLYIFILLSRSNGSVMVWSIGIPDRYRYRSIN